MDENLSSLSRERETSRSIRRSSSHIPSMHALLENHGNDISAFSSHIADTSPSVPIAVLFPLSSDLTLARQSKSGHRLLSHSNLNLDSGEAFRRHRRRSSSIKGIPHVPRPNTAQLVAQRKAEALRIIELEVEYRAVRSELKKRETARDLIFNPRKNNTERLAPFLPEYVKTMCEDTQRIYIQRKVKNLKEKRLKLEAQRFQAQQNIQHLDQVIMDEFENEVQILREAIKEKNERIEREERAKSPVWRDISKELRLTTDPRPFRLVNPADFRYIKPAKMTPKRFPNCQLLVALIQKDKMLTEQYYKVKGELMDYTAEARRLGFGLKEDDRLGVWYPPKAVTVKEKLHFLQMTISELQIKKDYLRQSRKDVKKEKDDLVKALEAERRESERKEESERKSRPTMCCWPIIPKVPSSSRQNVKLKKR